jgi:hypothetical protein
MFVNVAYNLSGPPPETEYARAAFRRLFSLALYVDRGADGFASLRGYAYDPAFVERQTILGSLAADIMHRV